MKRIVLLIGIPGSGKSTLAQKLIERGFLCLNADAIRHELYGNEAEQGNPKEVFDVFFKRLNEVLATGKDVVIDNTNLNQKQRKPILEQATAAGYTDIQLWWLDVPLATCLQRNQQRSRQVPEDIVTNMFNHLNQSGRPQQKEGKVIIARPGKDNFEWLFF